MTGFFAFLIKLGFGGIADKAIRHLERRAELHSDRDLLKAKTTVALAREAVAEAKVMAEFNRAKLAFPWFWAFAALFVLPLGIYFAAIIAYNLFWCAGCAYPKPWTIAALPPPLDDWAGRMIAWLFFIGSGIGAISRFR